MHTCCDPITVACTAEKEKEKGRQQQQNESAHTGEKKTWRGGSEHLRAEKICSAPHQCTRGHAPTLFAHPRHAFAAAIVTRLRVTLTLSV